MASIECTETVCVLFAYALVRTICCLRDLPLRINSIGGHDSIRTLEEKEWIEHRHMRVRVYVHVRVYIVGEKYVEREKYAEPLINLKQFYVF